MVVAGAEVGIGAQFSAFAPDHQRHLGMSLQLDETVYHLNAGPLHLARPADVRRFVETRPEFHHRGDQLPGFGGGDQRFHDRRILRCAVQSLLYRHHRGVGGCAAQELHHHVKALVRVLNHEVLGANGGQDVAAVFPHPLGVAHVQGFVLQVASLVGNDLLDVRQAQHAVDIEDVGMRGVERLEHKTAEVLGHSGGHLHPDDVASPAAQQCGLKGPNQVLSFLVDLQIAVAADSEYPVAKNLHAGKQPLEILRDDLFNDDKPQSLARHSNEPLNLLRNQHQAVELPLVLWPLEPQNVNEKAGLNEGEGMRGIHGLRGQHRK